MFFISDCEFLVFKTDSLIQRFSSFEKEIPKIVLKFMNQRALVPSVFGC